MLCSLSVSLSFFLLLSNVKVTQNPAAHKDNDSTHFWSHCSREYPHFVVTTLLSRSYPHFGHRVQTITFCRWEWIGNYIAEISMFMFMSWSAEWMQTKWGKRKTTIDTFLQRAIKRGDLPTEELGHRRTTMSFCSTSSWVRLRVGAKWPSLSRRPSAFLCVLGVPPGL